MRIAVIADIHANLEAMNAVLADIAAAGISVIVQLGDLVGYNASPRECVDLATAYHLIGVQGNHDRAVVAPAHAEGFNIFAHQVVTWTAGELDATQKAYLEKQPLNRILWNRYLLFHGGPQNPDAYLIYLFQARKAFNYMRKVTPGVRVAFFGHTHKRALWQRDERGKVSSLEIDRDVFTLYPGQMYLINPGSVGQPRQNVAEASYLIFSTEPETVRFRSVPYDVRRAQRKIRRACLPEFLAERLAWGR